MTTNSDPALAKHDNRVARPKRWLASLVVMANAAALLATSPEPRYSYIYSKSVDGPEVELSNAASHLRLLVTVRARELAPNGRSTTENASANVSINGALTPSVPQLFVRARIDHLDGTSAGALNVLTQFQLADSLRFEGDCATLEDATRPCQAQFFVDLARTDTNAGSVKVTWHMDFSASVEKSEPNQELELPWDVQVEAQ
ncbi:MAG: hypothetical protein QM756_35125 [Polyangiaceae bacterium]